MSIAASQSLIQVSPFLKWAGGKSSLLPQLGPLFPRHYGRYHEPFLGGGAVFLHLQPPSAHLSDINPRLIDCYKAIRDELDDVLARLEALRGCHSPEHYYRARQRLNADRTLPRSDRAALQVYLNKTCYNGLYRENRHGEFNVPLGRYQNPSIYSADNLRAVSAMLGRAQLECLPFESVLERARPGDFVYLDPPYAPLSRTSSFTSFTRWGFDSFDQTRLLEVCRALDAHGVRFMLSNSSSPLVRELYRGFHVHSIEARRSINSKATRRGVIAELVVRNYES